MKLLAVINREVAAKDKTVSPFCQVAFRNADAQFGPNSKASPSAVRWSRSTCRS